MASAVDGCKEAVNSGHWPLFRYDPRLARQGKNPLQLDSKEPTMSFADYAQRQNRYRVLTKADPDTTKRLMEEANRETATRFDLYRKLAEMQADCGTKK
jgi:pyruvate-ferredoxin/flavodoxin oxidoreductase